MQSYIKFEIHQGTYDISCPDAQCEKHGVISLSEIEILVSKESVERHRKCRLNREVALDVNITWCPRAGCETVCDVSGHVDRCLPQSVHCPTCSTDFCSNCKNPWHSGLSCEQNARRLTKEGHTDLMQPHSDIVKRCPNRNILIEKKGGCAQMTCRCCQHYFCWHCLASLDFDLLLTHYHKGPCKNKFDSPLAVLIIYRALVFIVFTMMFLVAFPLFLVVIL
jgi:E3 ubiquitin-protein ligase RNF144